MTSLTTAGPAHAAGPARSRPRRRDPKQRDPKKWVEIGVFTGPALILFLGFVILPVVLAAIYSFYNLRPAFRWGDLNADSFIGFDNYTRAFHTEVFRKAVGNTFLIMALSLLVQGPLAIGVALLLHRKLRGRSIYRLLVFVPYVLAEVIGGLAWKLMLQSTGFVNEVFSHLGWSDPPGWLANPKLAIWTVFFVLTWKYLGFAVLLMLAGLQGIPEELHEAAALDGASWWQVQRHITIPLLGPTIRIWAFLSIIGSLQVFDMVWVTVPPAIRGLGTDTIVTYLVQQGQFAGQPGYGSAIAVILFLISLVIALVYQRIALRRDLAGAVTAREE